MVKKRGGGVKNTQLSPIKPGLIKMITKWIYIIIKCQIIWKKDNMGSKDLYPILGSTSDKVV